MENKIFTPLFLKSLIENSKFDEANEYIKKYFFKSGIYRFFRDGSTNSFIKYEIQEANKLIPNDLVKYDKKQEVYNPITYLKSTEFMSKDYLPEIEFSIDNITFTKVSDYGIETNYLNMAKSMPKFDHINADYETYMDDIELINNHIRVVWANNNEAVYKWIMNFNTCTLTGKRKLRKALYMQCEKERAGRGSILNFFRQF